MEGTSVCLWLKKKEIFHALSVIVLLLECMVGVEDQSPGLWQVRSIY